MSRATLAVEVPFEIGDVEYTLEATVSPVIPARGLNGPPERSSPEEGGEVEFVRVLDEHGKESRSGLALVYLDEVLCKRLEVQAAEAAGDADDDEPDDDREEWS